MGPKSQHPDRNNGRMSTRKREKHRLRLSGSAAARLPRRDNHQSRGYRQADRPERVTKRDIRRAPESEIKERGQQKNKLKQSERRKLIELRRARGKRTGDCLVKLEVGPHTAGNNKRAREGFLGETEKGPLRNGNREK